jgi:hypothetical protein
MQLTTTLHCSLVFLALISCQSSVIILLLNTVGLGGVTIDEHTKILALSRHQEIFQPWDTGQGALNH